MHEQRIFLCQHFDVVLNSIPLVFSSEGLKLEGVKKVWGMKGYLRSKESKEETSSKAIAVSEGEMAAQCPSTAESVVSISAEEQERQRLASSLFVGLGSNNLVNLVS